MYNGPLKLLFDHRGPFLARRLAILAVLVLAGSPGCEAPPAEPPNVVLVSIDSLRADHVGAYGYGIDTTPFIDRFRGDAVLFEEAISQAPSTLASHASMLSSLLPTHHGASVSNKFAIDPGAPLLAEILQDVGYDTASFNGGVQLDPIYGLGRGFDLYQVMRAEADVDTEAGQRFDLAVDAAITWIEERHGAPFFLFLHTYEMHNPYTPRPGYRELVTPPYAGSLPGDISVELLKQINAGRREIDQRDLVHIVGAYDAELRSVDEAFGRLVDFLVRQGLYDNTLIVVVSDHGEEFGEHGSVGWHSHTLFDELLRIPMILKLPGGEHAGASVSAQVRAIDLAPTVLEQLGLPVPESFEGTSLLGVASGEAHPVEYAVSQRDVTLPAELSVIRSRKWKRMGRFLFDLSRDRWETSNAAKANPEVHRELSLRASERVGVRPPSAFHAVEPNAPLVDELRALGYVE